MEARTKRQLAMLEARRSMVIEAAMRVAERVGLQRTSVREIAKEAGYTPGALYAFFRNKQDVLAVLARQALDHLARAVQTARVPRGQESQALLIRGDAWIEYLLNNKRDWDVISQVVLGPLQRDLEVQQAVDLHRALRESLALPAKALVDLGMDPAHLDQELESMLSMALGLLVSQDTTRLQPPSLAPQQLWAQYLEARAAALTSRADVSADPLKNADGKGKKQVDLFG